jgi:hypothetical protein
VLNAPTELADPLGTDPYPGPALYFFLLQNFGSALLLNSVWTPGYVGAAFDPLNISAGNTTGYTQVVNTIDTGETPAPDDGGFSDPGTGLTFGPDLNLGGSVGWKGDGPRGVRGGSVRQKVCSAIPQGRVTSVNYSLGGIGGQNGSLSTVVNYDSGQVSGFATGGMQLGWNGLVQASVSTGFIYGALGSNNSGYSGTFTGGSFSGAAFGGFGSSGNGVQVYGASLGASFSPFTFAVSRTATTSPLGLGSAIGTLFTIPLDNALTLARRTVCK